MDVSNQETKPGRPPAAGLLSISSNTRKVVHGALLLVLAIASLLAHPASAFTIASPGRGLSVPLSTADITQNGVPLGGAAEQIYDQGVVQADLADFAVPLDVNLSGALSGATVATRVDVTNAFRIRLSRSERNRCLQDGDFDIDVDLNGPVPGALPSIEPGGGYLRLVRFEPVHRGGIGGRCPNNIFYGLRMELSVLDAVAAGVYEGSVQVTVDLPGPGGSSQSIQIPLEVRMPGILLLYHYSRIDVNLDATVLAGVLGADRACSGGFCMDVGSRVIPVSNLAMPVALNVSADAPGVNPVQTITLRDAVAVRAAGCSGGVYDTATYQILNPFGGIQAASGVINGIQSAPCGLELRSGDLSFDLDLSQVDAATGSAAATIQITVTGL